MCIVYGPYEVSIIMISRQLENIHTFYLEKRISCYGFLNKCSKELFDDGVDIHRQKEGFLKKKKDVPFELHDLGSKIITVKT